MRYQTTDLPVALGIFPTGQSVVVDVTDVTNGSVVSTGTAAAEIGTTGIYTLQLTATELGGALPTTHTEYVWTMRNPNQRRNYGKFTVHGYPEYVQDETLYQDGVWVDTGGGGSAGTRIGINATRGNPSDNLADALTIAAAVGVRALNLRGTITLTQSFANWIIEGTDASAVINLANQDITDARIRGCDLSGTVNGVATFERCNVTFNLTNVNGTWIECIFSGNLQFATGADVFSYNCVGNTSIVPIFDFAGFNNATISAVGWKGPAAIRNMSGAAAVADIRMDFGTLDIQASNTAGSTFVSGFGTFTDNSGAGHTVDDALLFDPTDPDADWSETEREEIRFRLGMNGTQTDPTLTPNLARQQDILSDATPFPGANIDATISSRSTLAQADILSDATPFPGANIDAAVSTRATQADILSDATPFPGANIDAAISSRSTLAQADILSDATPFPGANIDATISSRSTLVQADILSDATPFPGANIDAAISSRATVAGIFGQLITATVDFETVVLEIYQDRGLDVAEPKTITENTVGADYDEDVDAVQKSVIKAGNVTTITRS